MKNLHRVAYRKETTINNHCTDLQDLLHLSATTIQNFIREGTNYLIAVILLAVNMATSETKLINIDLRETGVAVLQLNRPKKRNAFNQAMINDIVQTLQNLDQNKEVRVVVVTGGDSAHFCGMFIQSCAD